MSKHTPGPWRVREGLRKFDFDEKERRDLYVCDPAGIGLWDVHGSVYEPADAALIAAAPTMLEALKMLDKFWSADGFVSPRSARSSADLTQDTIDLWKSIRAAIKLAEEG